ncbi:MAG: amidohydrolase [Planctomycetes bacterium]|nr:amidohydrolase [Planctomycetota bacterium]
MVDSTSRASFDAKRILAESQRAAPWITDARRALHQCPELMYQEFETSEIIRSRLDELGIAYRHPVATTGICAWVGRGEPCVALRADIDGLPITEDADVPFRSRNRGKMHACGHDAHAAMLLGAARLLKERESSLRGTVKLLFQPAEEGGAGGLRMCEEGVLRDPDVGRIFGMHVWPMLPTGTVGGRAGTFMAATGFFRITVAGKGGHAAMPHYAVDPVLAASHVVTSLQSIIAREIDPLASGVVSVTAVHGGDACNVIPESVTLRGTLRSLSSAGLHYLQQRVREIASSVAAAHRCQAEFAGIDTDYPAVVNESESWHAARQVAESLVGEPNVAEIPPVMGGEDFAFYTDRVPGCFLALGIHSAESGAVHSVHHPKFQVDERALPIGTALHVLLAARALDDLTA